MNPGNINVLANLGNLEVLNLNGNLLGPMLDLSRLPKLRRVSLRRTGLDEWPRGLLTGPCWHLRRKVARRQMNWMCTWPTGSAGESTRAAQPAGKHALQCVGRGQ